MAKEFDILELYNLAKAKDPFIGRAEARLEGGKAEHEIAWSALMPRVTAGASLRQFWHEVENYYPETTKGDYTGYSYNIGATLPVVAVPSYYQITATNAGMRSAEAAIDSARQDLMARLVAAYVGLLKAQTDELLYRDEMLRVGKVLEQTKAFLEAGTVDIITTSEAKARLDSAAADLVKIQAQRRMAEQYLASITGITVETVKKISIMTPQRPHPDDLEWWIGTMSKHNPALIQALEDYA
jgi:outer membrane protein TolC